MHGQGHAGRYNHRKIAETQLPRLLREQAPDPDPHGIARVLDVAQHGRHDHDSEPNPEENEEAAEVSVFAVDVEMGHARGILDCREKALPLLGPDLPSCRRYRMSRRRRICRDWSGAAATVVSTSLLGSGWTGRRSYLDRPEGGTSGNPFDDGTKEPSAKARRSFRCCLCASRARSSSTKGRRSVAVDMIALSSCV